MRKFKLIGLSLLVFVAATVVIGWSQDDMTVVDNTVFDNPQRTPSRFEHDLHNEIAGIDDCAECHHVYEDGVKLEDESSEDLRCADCHALEASGDTPSLIKAFHLNCKGCHQTQGKGPILCGECHIK